LVVADHSPTVLLALWGKTIPKANIGLGFFCPPPAFPLPHWLAPHEKHLLPRVLEDERAMTAAINRVLQVFHRPPLMHLGQIYGQVEETILATYEEFDHFGPRPGMRYWGHWPFGSGITPRWPEGRGPKIYAYLKPFPLLEHLLGILRQSGYPTLVYASGIDAAVRDRHQAVTLRFETSPLDLKAAAHKCDLAITHGHGTAVGMLLAGKPVIVVPLFTEQMLFAQKVQDLQMGRCFVPDNVGTWSAAFSDVLHHPVYRAQASHFAGRYEIVDADSQISAIAQRLDHLLRVGSPGRYRDGQS